MTPKLPAHDLNSASNDWPLETPLRFTRESSLARLYAPAIAFERLSMTLDRIPQVDDESEAKTDSRPTSSHASIKHETMSRQSMQLNEPTNVQREVLQDKSALITSQPIVRDFGVNHNTSVRRKPVPHVLDAPLSAAPATAQSTGDEGLPRVGSSEAMYLQQVGNAAQAKRKKRRVSVAVSEMLSGFGDKKEGSEGAEMGEDGEAEGRPRRIKRLRTRISSWFVAPRKEN